MFLSGLGIIVMLVYKWTGRVPFSSIFQEFE
jgi:hypothetical protein